ncbi:MAG: polysaccharide export protein [Gemmatimonadetes bacterium]|nr:polysaccharide export protein [Gemmatimonadota bacterium]
MIRHPSVFPRRGTRRSLAHGIPSGETAQLDVQAERSRGTSICLHAGDRSHKSLVGRFSLVALIALSACVPAVPLPPTVQPTPRAANEWIVEPGDVIRLRVWLSVDQSGDIPVNERGQILVPTVGRLSVAGSTPPVVESLILRAYAARLDSSKVEVLFLRPVSVLGGVKNPGIQLADPSATVLSLISRAGGPLRPGGDLRAYLLRIGEPTREISLADHVSDLGIRAADQLYVQDPPFVVRNEIAIRSAFELLQVVSTVITLIVLVRR